MARKDLNKKIESAVVETSKLVNKLNELKAAGEKGTAEFITLAEEAKKQLATLSKLSTAISNSFSQTGNVKQFNEDVKKVGQNITKVTKVQKDSTKVIEDAEKKSLQRRERIQKAWDSRKAKRLEAEELKKKKADKDEETRRKRVLDNIEREEIRKFKARVQRLKQEQKEQEAAEKRRSVRGGFGAQFTGRAIGGAIGSLTKYLGLYQLLNTAVTAFNELTIGSVRQAIAFEKAVANLSAVAGATSEEVKALSKNALDVAGTTKFTAEEIVGLQTELAKLGFSAEDVVASTSAIANASQALNTPLDATALLIGKVRNQFGLLVESTSEIADTLVTTINESALSMDSFGVAIQYVGPIASQLGLNLQQVSGAMAVLADNGFTASRIGTGLRGILTELGKESGDAQASLRKLAAENINLAEAADLVGKRNAAQLLTLLENLDAIDEANTKYYQQGRALQSSATQIDTFSGQLDILTAAWRRYQISLGESIVKSDLIITVLENLAPKAAATARAFQLMNDVGFDKYEESVDRIVGGADDFDEALRLAGVTIEEYDKSLELLQQGKVKGSFLAQSSNDFRKEYDAAVKVFDTVEGIGEQLLLSVQAKKDDINITKGQDYANKVYGKTVDSLIKKSIQGINVNKEISAEYDNLTYSITLLDEKIKTATGSRLLQLKSERAVYKQMKEQLNNSLLDEDGIYKAREKDQRDRIQLRLDEIKRRTKEEVDSLNERAKVETKIAKTAAERADIEAERTLLVSEAYQRQSKDIRALSGEFDTQIEKIEKAAQASDDLSKILTSDIIDDVKSAVADYSDEITKLDQKLADNQITQEEYNAAREAQYETLKNNIEAFKQLGDISPEVAAFFDEIAKKALEAGYALDSLPDPLTGWDKFVKDFEDGGYLDVLGDAINRTGDVLGDFSSVALENTKNRIASELELIKSRYETEDFLAKQQLQNGLINEEQFRRKQSELRKKQVQEENKLAKELFEAERKQERQDVTIDAAVSTGEAIIGAISDYGFPAGLGIGALLSSLIAGQLAGQLSAISSKKFYEKKFEEGGMVEGPSHAQGGVPFTVQGQGGYEMEGGEFIVNKKASSLHRHLLESINNSVKPNSSVQPMKFATGGVVSSTFVNNNTSSESVDYLRAIAEATTSTAIQTSKPVRAFVTSTDLRKDESARRIKENNTII
jgi:hypothetical protein